MTPDSAAAGSQERQFEANDRTIQLLFGMGLKLEYSMQLVDEEPEQAKHGIDSVISSLGQLINELRSGVPVAGD